MKIPLIKKIAGVLFALGFTSGIFFFLAQNFKINVIPIDPSIYLGLFFAFGILGFALNLVSFKKDTVGIKSGNLMYWLGASMVLVGLLLYFFQIILWNWILLSVGCLLILISFYLNRKKKPQKSEFIDVDE
jgi:4-hydroxybenzoate polyprenyltransferase